MIKNFKIYIVDMLIISGLFFQLKFLWDNLEKYFDGGIQISVADSIVAVILVITLWIQIRKWITIVEK